MIHINKWVYKWSKVFPVFSKNIITQSIAFLIAATVFSYIGMTVAILNWDDVMTFHGQVNHWGTITLITLTVCSFLINPPKSKS
jgi:FtsH-binding integral membrane protein